MSRLRQANRRRSDLVREFHADRSNVSFVPVHRRLMDLGHGGARSQCERRKLRSTGERNRWNPGGQNQPVAQTSRGTNGPPDTFSRVYWGSK